MATVHPVPSPRSQQVMHEGEHPQWIKAFPTEMRSQQLAEDNQAWTAVTGTLLTIVTIGVILAAITVSICLSY